MERILVVDDDGAMRLALTEVLERGGFLVRAVASATAALEALAEERFAVVVSDMRMPGLGGSELLERIRRRHPGQAVVMITAYGTIEEAVHAMKNGARDFLTKPFSPRDLLHVLRGIVEDPPRPEGGGPAALAPGGRAIVFRSPAMQRVLGVAEAVAASRAPVLLQGESGTGKELLARYIHEAGPRRSQPFVAVNCAALPRELLESELFGHERGAFTGAVARKPGRFELAHRGTILLDEISEMEPLLQAKLLRVLQEHEVDRVGGTRPTPVDARVVATTNRDLRSMVAAGSFRRDLYYRLNVVPITLPALRERVEDVDLLVDHFCRKYAAGREVRVDPEARARLRAHSWPGNIRELEHVIERALLLTPGERIGVEDLRIEDDPGAVTASEAGSTSLAGRTVHEVERQLIVETLKRTNNNRSHAARMLGISVRTLRNKLAEYRGSGLLEGLPS